MELEYNPDDVMFNPEIGGSHFFKDIKEGEEYELFPGLLNPNKEVEASQVGGDHYSKHNIEPLDIVEDWFGTDGLRAALTCKVLKYVCRYRDKNGVEDLDKAINCIEKLKGLE